MKRILMLTVPHELQRYDTVGDYLEGHGLAMFRVSDMGDDRYEQLVAVHELLEYILVKARGIPLEAIDDFDMKFEDKREPGNEDEPGHDPAAPYHKEHVFAEKVERMLAEELGINWEDYEKVIMSL